MTEGLPSPAPTEAILAPPPENQDNRNLKLFDVSKSSKPVCSHDWTQGFSLSVMPVTGVAGTELKIIPLVLSNFVTPLDGFYAFKSIKQITVQAVSTGTLANSSGAIGVYFLPKGVPVATSGEGKLEQAMAAIGTTKASGARGNFDITIDPYELVPRGTPIEYPDSEDFEYGNLVFFVVTPPAVAEIPVFSITMSATVHYRIKALIPFNTYISEKTHVQSFLNPTSSHPRGVERTYSGSRTMVTYWWTVEEREPALAMTHGTVICTLPTTPVMTTSEGDKISLATSLYYEQDEINSATYWAKSFYPYVVEDGDPVLDEKFSISWDANVNIHYEPHSNPSAYIESYRQFLKKLTDDNIINTRQATAKVKARYNTAANYFPIPGDKFYPFHRKLRR